jgi:hypothetical protein
MGAGIADPDGITRVAELPFLHVGDGVVTVREPDQDCLPLIGDQQVVEKLFGTAPRGFGLRRIDLPGNGS